MPNINTDAMSWITTEKARIIQQLSQVEAQGATLSGQLQAFNSVESVLLGTKTTTRRSSAAANKTATAVEKITLGSAPRRGRGRPPRTVTETDGIKTKIPRGAASDSSLYNTTLSAVRDRPGQTGAQIAAYINQHQTTPVRPNHVGVMLSRHANAGRLVFSGEKKNRTWYEPTAMPMAKAS